MLPFSQHSHFVVHRSHCKWKKKVVSSVSQSNQSPWTPTAWLGLTEKEWGALLGPQASYADHFSRNTRVYPEHPCDLGKHRYVLTWQWACRPNSAKLLNCMLNLEDNWHVLQTSLWLHLSLAIFDGSEPEAKDKSVANVETEPKLLWTSSVFIIPLNNCSWLLLMYIKKRIWQIWNKLH